MFGLGLAADGGLQHLSLHGTHLQRHETGDSTGRLGELFKTSAWWLVVGYDEYDGDDDGWLMLVIYF